LQNSPHYRDLRERKIDLLVARITSPSEDDIQDERLFYDTARIVTDPKSRWARRRSIELPELAHEPWCLPPLNSLIGSLVEDAFRARGMKFPPTGATSGGAAFICAYLLKRPALGMLPTSLLRIGENLPRLKVLPVDLPIPRWPVGIMLLKNRTLTPVVQHFIDCAREVAKPMVTKGADT
jgi:DNA-binding transcriptional LysR family regulator